MMNNKGDILGCKFEVLFQDDIPIFTCNGGTIDSKKIFPNNQTFLMSGS